VTEPNAGKPRRKFTDDFCADAIGLATSSQTTIAQTARDLGMGDTLLGGWIAAAKAPETSLTMSEPTELATHRRENRRLLQQTLHSRRLRVVSSTNWHRSRRATEANGLAPGHWSTVRLIFTFAEGPAP
jgi:transposase